MGSKRQQIAYEAARLLVSGAETDPRRARDEAARRLSRPGSSKGALPSTLEIEREVETLGLLQFVPVRDRLERHARLEAYGLLRALRRFHPTVSGGAISGHAADGAVTQVSLATNRHSSTNLQDACSALAARGLDFTVTPGGGIEVFGRFPVQVSLRPSRGLEASRGESDAEGEMGLAEFEAFLSTEYPWVPLGSHELDADGSPVIETVDAHGLFHNLLVPLHEVKLPAHSHPEGDALFHSLQVFQRASRELPYDSDVLTAALLHMAGLALDAEHPLDALLETIGDCINERIAFFLCELPFGIEAMHGNLGDRTLRRLRAHEDYEELLVLARCDEDGREVGVPVPEIDEALDYLRELASYEDVA